MLPQFTLVEHLTEIRKRLIKTLIAFIAIFIYVYTKTDQLIDFILDMATKIDFIYTKPEELLMSYLKLDFLAALLLTVPIFMFQCWRFVRPALKKNERLKCLIFFLMATILFFAGASFSLFVTTPLCLRFLSEFTNYKIDPMLSIENYLSFIINMTTVFGIVFDVPAVIYFLASINLIRYSTTKKAPGFCQMLCKKYSIFTCLHFQCSQYSILNFRILSTIITIRYYPGGSCSSLSISI